MDLKLTGGSSRQKCSSFTFETSFLGCVFYHDCLGG